MSGTPRLQLRRTRRGWMVAALASLALGGGLAVGGLAAAEGPGTACSPESPAVTVEETPVGGGPDQASECVETQTDTQTNTQTTTTEEPPPDRTSEQPPATTTPAPPATTPAPAPADVPAAPVAEGMPASLVAEPEQEGALEEQKATRQPADAPKEQQPAAPKPADPEGQVEVVESAPTANAQGLRATPSDQIYFPPVSVDWDALTPLAPPPFPGSAAQSFPGPEFLLPIFEAAAVDYGVPWQVLAAINEVESDWGRNQGPSSAGAVGWMQFLPSTWRHFGVDANGDGETNPADPVDAIFSAAHYLQAAGARYDLARAIFAYNHSNRYVDQVVQRAIELGSIPDDLLVALTERGRREASAIHRATGSQGLLDPDARITSTGRAMLLGDEPLRRHILGNPNIDIYACGREDIAAGIVDRRVLEALQYLSGRGLSPTVTSLRCGHGYYTRSGNVSEHSSGDAVDIVAINGTPILGHQGEGSITERTITQLLKLGGGMRPHQIISLMTFSGAPNTLALGDHADHIHVGFEPAREIAPE